MTDDDRVGEMTLSPRLKNLPPAPAGMTGWPWDVDGHDPAPPLDGRRWPRISIVTPNYNQGEFIEETIRSVLLQGYPDVEFIIVDGGSTDDSVDIIRKYEPWLAYWVSEPDRGQSHAINKGLARATGDIVAYINSDDTYVKDAFAAAARILESNPNSKWLVGGCYIMHDREPPKDCSTPEFTDDLEAWFDKRCGLPQCSTFLRREVLAEVGGLEESLDYAFDHEYWIRLVLAGQRPLLDRTPLASFRLHGAAKTASGPDRFRQDHYRIEELHLQRLPKTLQKKLIETRPMRHWEAEVRDGLELCMVGQWREGSAAVFRRLLDRRLLLVLLQRPQILARLFRAGARRGPRFLRNKLSRNLARQSS